MKNPILLLFFVVSFAACNVTRKSRSISKTLSESSAAFKSDSASVLRSDSSGTIKESGDYERTTTYDYDTLIQYVSLAGRIDTVIRYVPRIMKVHERGNYNSEKTAIKILYDSTDLRKDNKTCVSKQTEIVTKSKDSYRLTLWVVIVFVVIVLLLAAYRLYMKGIFK